jgi:hypothetical protein
MSRRFDEGAWADAWTSRFPEKKQPRRRRFVIGAALILALLVSPFAIAKDLKLGSNNAKRKSVKVKSKTNSYALKLRNNGTEGGALDAKCKTANNAKACIRANNTADGQALELKTSADTTSPIKTNSKGRVDNLNVDMLDSLNSTQFLGSTLRVRLNTQGLADGTNAAANVTCQAGETLVGGGGSIGTFSEDIYWLSSRPADANGGLPAEGSQLNTWRTAARNKAGGTGNTTITAWAVCANTQ